MPHSIRVAALILVLSLPAAVACHRGSENSQKTTTAPSHPTDEAPGEGMNGITKPIMELLSEERANRPSGTPAAEAVFAAAKQAGVPTSDQAQVLARMLGASYCENARTAKGVVLSVCEFKDPATLAKGQAYSEKTFAKALPNRSLLANRKTLLTINPPDETSAVKAEVKTVADAFARL
jgi:hypothetical protein